MLDEQYSGLTFHSTIQWRPIGKTTFSTNRFTDSLGDRCVLKRDEKPLVMAVRKYTRQTHQKQKLIL